MLQPPHRKIATSAVRGLSQSHIDARIQSQSKHNERETTYQPFLIHGSATQHVALLQAAQVVDDKFVLTQLNLLYVAANTQSDKGQMSCLSHCVTMISHLLFPFAGT